MTAVYDVAVIGAGAAGLTAAIFAAQNGARVIALDGAKKIGAKILISGGGRCNVTHDVVDAKDFSGNRNAIAKVLRSFSVEETIDWFASMGVSLKREETGKLFPTSDRAATVLNALLDAAASLGVELRTGFRVETIAGSGLLAEGPSSQKDPLAQPAPLPTTHDPRRTHDPRPLIINNAIEAHAVILATGGQSVPKTGSDGFGYSLAKSLGHSVTETFPALVPLVIEEKHWMRELSGTSAEVELVLRSSTGKILHRDRGSMLMTHFGISGPVVLDISRHWIAERKQDDVAFVANFLPDETFESVDRLFVESAKENPRSTIGSVLRGKVPERVLDALGPRSSVLGSMSREKRREVARNLTEVVIPVARDRGFDYAEVTAGGVPLSEVDLTTMESRIRPNLYLCGEILDVDGRIGGYNFQWAWASGRLAGRAAATK